MYCEGSVRRNKKGEDAIRTIKVSLVSTEMGNNKLEATHVPTIRKSLDIRVRFKIEPTRKLDMIMGCGLRQNGGRSFARTEVGSRKVRVALRCRPALFSSEKDLFDQKIDPAVVVQGESGEVSVEMRRSRVKKKFQFDLAFGPESTQVEVYQKIGMVNFEDTR